MPDVISIVSGAAQGLSLVSLKLGGINGKGVGNAVVGTVPPGNKNFLPIAIYVDVTAPQPITTPPIVSLGTVSPFNNLVTATTLNGAANAVDFLLALLSPWPRLSPGTVVTGAISQAAVSAGAVTLTLIALGFWV